MPPSLSNGYPHRYLAFRFHTLCVLSWRRLLGACFVTCFVIYLFYALAS